jgi:hypothetical protein
MLNMNIYIKENNIISNISFIFLLCIVSYKSIFKVFFLMINKLIINSNSNQ